MPAAASRDLRQRAVKAYLGGEGSYEVLARRFNIGGASLRRWVKRMRERGNLEPEPHAGGVSAKVSDEDLPKLRALAEGHPYRTVAQITEDWCRRTERAVSRASVLRALHRAGADVTRANRGRRDEGGSLREPLGAPRIHGR